MADYAELIHGIQAGNYSPVYLLQGEEPFMIDNVIKHVEENALDESQRGFNQYILYGKETDFTQVIGTARKFPMMGERQVVIVKEAQEMRGWSDEKNQALMINYLENQVPSTILLFGYKYKKLDSRTKLAKAFQKEAIVMESKKIYDNEVPKWIQSYAGARKINLSHRAVMVLAENIGNNLQRLSNEIEKLLLNIPEGQEVDEKAVHRYVGISKEYNVFELQHALTSGNFSKALKIVDFFASNPSNNPLVLTIFNLFTYFSKIMLLHKSEAKDQNSVARLLGVHPFFVKEYMAAGNRYPLVTTIRNIQYIHEADLRSKGIDFTGGREKEGELLRELIYKLMH